MSGPLPPELGQLSQLDWLNLSRNRLTGEIPPELGDLKNLLVLDLNFNRLTGKIPPELGNLPKLYIINLRGLNQEYQLSGPIPPELGKLTDLIWLNLGGHNLTGEIPQELANLSKLEQLNLYFNELTGVLPSWVGDLSHLQELSLSKNRLSGPIPPEVGRLSELSKLNLWGNRFEGPLPRELGNLTKLTHLALSQNPLLSGPIPMEFTNLELTSFYWDESKLCSPPGPAFQRWLDGIGKLRGGPPCYAVALTTLYDSAGGAGWTNAANWGTGAPLSEWHGVTADEAGRVTGLDLRANGLAGRVPPELGVLGTWSTWTWRTTRWSAPCRPSLEALGPWSDLICPATGWRVGFPSSWATSPGCASCNWGATGRGRAAGHAGSAFGAIGPRLARQWPVRFVGRMVPGVAGRDCESCGRVGVRVACALERGRGACEPGGAGS